MKKFKRITLVFLYTFSLSACYAENTDIPEGWTLLTEKQAKNCNEEYTLKDSSDLVDLNDWVKNTRKYCGGTRPKPQKTELQWLKERMQQRLISIKGGEFIMGDFGPIHTKDSIPPVSSTIGYFRSGMEYDGHKIPQTYEIGLPYIGHRASGHYHNVSLDDYAMTSHMIEEQEYNLYGALKGELLLDSMEKRTYQDILDTAQVPAKVTWQQAQGFCQWLGDLIGQPMSLPTEAQWEYAGRNRGEFRVYPTNNGFMNYGDNIIYLESGINFKQHENQWRNNLAKFQSMPANPLGFYNMHNIGEWIYDWYDPDYYLNSPSNNPAGPQKGLSLKETGQVEVYSIEEYEKIISQNDKWDGASYRPYTKEELRQEAIKWHNETESKSKLLVKSVRGYGNISGGYVGTFARTASVLDSTFTFRCATIPQSK